MPDPATLPADVAAELERWIEEGRIDLPALPQAASELLRATFHEDCDLIQVENILQRDPHLAGQVLRMANSALYAPPVPIKTLRRALSQLGLLRVRDVALKVSCESRVFLCEAFKNEVNALMEHSKATAVIARDQARDAKLDPDEAFMAGLLHDVGRPILLQTLSDLLVVLKVKWKRKPEVDPAAALAATLRDHQRVGSSLLLKWNLPAALVTLAGQHHEPDTVEDEGVRRMGWLLRLADATAGEDEEMLEPALAALGLPADRAETLRARRPEYLEVARSL